MVNTDKDANTYVRRPLATASTYVREAVSSRVLKKIKPVWSEVYNRNKHLYAVYREGIIYPVDI